MTDTHHAPASDSAPPVPPHTPATSNGAAGATAPFVEAAASPEPEGQETAPRQEPERYIWQPPVPQFPPRPSQAPPVQYQGPQMQPPPVYTPQGPQGQGQQGQTVPYMPPQGQPQPPQQGQPPSQQPPQGQQYYAPPAPQQQMQPAYTPPMYAPPTKVYAPPPAPGTSRVRVGRQFARRTVRGMGGIGKVFSGARLPIAVLFLLLLGLIGWLAVDKMSIARTPKLAPNAVSTAPIVLPSEAPAVQDYLNAVRNSDVDLGWSTLSVKDKIHRLEQGDDKTVLKSFYSTLSKNNVVPTYKFVGAYGATSPNDFSQGGTYYYVQEMSIQGQAMSKPLVFVVNKDGKIDALWDWLYSQITTTRPEP